MHPVSERKKRQLIKTPVAKEAGDYAGVRCIRHDSAKII
jgi:hypothetical protein